MPKRFDTTLSSANALLLPSPRLLHAALSGLMVGAAFGCSDDNDSALSEGEQQEPSDAQLRAMCADMVADAKKSAAEEAKDSQCDDSNLDELCADRVKEAESARAEPDLDKECKGRVEDAVMSVESSKPELCADLVKEAEVRASTPKTREEKTTNTEQKEYTFAQLTKMCDERGGYTQVHGSCGGHNACAGFSYGDWGPGAAILVEHTCSGANSCAGLSCVVLPEDKRKDLDGAELYDVLFADTEPSSCSNCHAPHEDDKADLSKFNVYVLEGSTRTEANWLERSAAEQERVIAFGAHSVLSDGTAMENMGAYNKVLSRVEVERLVAHLRTLEPVIKVMKTKDPAPEM
jgi:hypothetical protein